MGAEEEKLKSYGTIDEYAEALSKGSGKGGVSAIVEEIPYIRVFLKHHCHKYTKSAWNYRTGGFGFVSIQSFSRCLCIFVQFERGNDFSTSNWKLIFLQIDLKREEYVFFFMRMKNPFC